MRTNSKPAQSKPPQTSSKPASKPASKGPSQAQSKKVEVQKVIIKSDGNEIKDALRSAGYLILK